MQDVRRLEAITLAEGHAGTSHSLVPTNTQGPLGFVKGFWGALSIIIGDILRRLAFECLTASGIEARNAANNNVYGASSAPLAQRYVSAEVHCGRCGHESPLTVWVFQLVVLKLPQL